MTNPFDAATSAMIECYEANQRDYRNGLLKPNHPVPAIADTETVFHLARFTSHEMLMALAWNGKWQDDLPDYCEVYQTI